MGAPMFFVMVRLGIKRGLLTWDDIGGDIGCMREKRVFTYRSIDFDIFSL